eukprot:scaffold242579_cov40-Tisochrysis_lutea.AAC.2
MTRFSPGYARAYLMPGPRNLLRLLEAPLFPSPARPCRSQSCAAALWTEILLQWDDAVVEEFARLLLSISSSRSLPVHRAPTRSVGRSAEVHIRQGRCWASEAAVVGTSDSAHVVLLLPFVWLLVAPFALVH